MIALIFEVEPAAGRFDEYLERAAQLRPELEKVPGFVSVEHFRSRTTPDKLPSLGTAAQMSPPRGCSSKIKLRSASRRMP